MTLKIAYCAGHGVNTPGKQTPDGEKEWSFNNKVARAFADEIQKYEGVQLLRTDDPTGKIDVPLKTRTDKANAWGANVYISFHHNANTGKWGEWTGVETHVYKTKPADSVRLAKLVQPAIVKAYGLRDRGIKYTDLHITRETKCTAILIEGGFMDSRIDIKKLRDDKVLEKAGWLIAQAVAKYAKLKRKEEPKPTLKPTPKTTSKDNLYRVQVGAFNDKKNAERLVAELKKKGYPAFITK
ncbi:N-acetylmuramoyl-L-alanine amidase [Aeribacillus sp. FSL M8-0235]|uniref:N-acetylmuramoyl-L-alanine amidase n=1 Tax=Aeribacillus sp. FSL M8-0235 TaxID=2954576 RepID=UPI0030FA2942